MNGVAGLWEALLSCAMREGGIGKRLDEIGVLGSFVQQCSISVCAATIFFFFHFQFVARCRAWTEETRGHEQKHNHMSKGAARNRDEMTCRPVLQR